MKIRDLPPEKREELLGICAVHGLNCDHILRFAIKKLQFNTPSAAEDQEARIERVLKWGVLKNEFDRLIDPIRAQYPDLGTEKLISLLSGADQARAYAIDRELLDMTGVTQVKRGRQTWQEAVENEILRQLHRASIDVNQIVAAVLSRDPAYPAGPVQQYVESVFERAILREHLALRRMKDTNYRGAPLPGDRYEMTLLYSQRIGWRSLSTTFASNPSMRICRMHRTSQTMSDRYQSSYGLVSPGKLDFERAKDACH